MTLKKGHNSTKGHNPDFKKIRVNYFLMRNPYMKFQNCIFINFEAMHGQKDGRTKGRTDAQKSLKQYAPSTFPWLGA